MLNTHVRFSLGQLQMANRDKKMEAMRFANYRIYLVKHRTLKGRRISIVKIIA